MAGKRDGSLQEVLVHRRSSSFHDESPTATGPPQASGASYGNGEGGARGGILPTIQSSETLAMMESNGSGSSVTLTPPSQVRPSLGARLAASLRRSLVSQQAAAAAVAAADNDDLSRVSDASRLTHDGDNEDPPTPKAWPTNRGTSTDCGPALDRGAAQARGPTLDRGPTLERGLGSFANGDGAGSTLECGLGSFANGDSARSALEHSNGAIPGEPTVGPLRKRHRRHKTTDMVVDGIPDPSSHNGGNVSIPGADRASIAGGGMQMGTARIADDDETDSTGTIDEQDLELSDSDVEEIDRAAEKAPAKRRRRRKWHVLALVASVVVFLGGVTLRVLDPQPYAGGNVTAWRWVMLAGLIVPSYWVGEGCALAIEACIEWNFFENRRVLYYFLGTTKPLGRMFKAGFLPVLWLTIMRQQSNSSRVWNQVYHWILKLLLCGFLFTVAMFVSTILAKLLASYFHKQAFFDKMQDTLKQEFYLQALSRPRDSLKEPTLDSETEGPASPKGASTASHKPASSNRTSVDSKLEPPPAVPATQSQQRLLPLQPSAASFTGGSPTAAVAGLGQITTPATAPVAGVRGGSADGRESASASMAASVPPTSPFSNQDRSVERPVARTGTTKSLVTSPAALGKGGGLHDRSSSVLSGSKDSAVGSVPKAGVAARKYNKRALGVLQSVQEGVGKRHGRTARGEEEILEEAILRKPDLANQKLLTRMQKVETHLRQQNYAVTFDRQLGAAKAQKGETADREAKRLAFYIFWNAKGNFDRNYLVLSDFRRFMDKTKARAAFRYMDDNDSGRVGQSEVLAAVAQIFRDRRNLAIALKDTRSVIGTLQAVIGIVVHVAFFFFYLLVLNISLDNMWTTVASGILGFSFIFGNSIRGVFESVLTLFVVHPFDVGDTVFIDGAFCVIEEASLTKVVLKRWDGARIWYPNQMINSNTIVNVTRTDTRCQCFKVLVDTSTPASVCEHLKEVLTAFFEERATELKPEPSIGFWAPATDPMKVYLAVYFNWTFNAFEDADRAGPTRHDLFMLISETLVELKVQYTLPAFARGNDGGGAASGTTMAAQRSLLRAPALNPHRSAHLAT